VDELTETEMLVMTYRVFGFVLRSRKWGKIYSHSFPNLGRQFYSSSCHIPADHGIIAQLDLTFLRYENSNARNLTVNAFEGLELPDGHREIVKSLVVQHFRSKQSDLLRNEQTDLIQGKGTGKKKERNRRPLDVQAKK
jgi:hypothetical protein